MQFPLIHLNGTCADNLLADQCDIARALRDALEVMANNGPNGRDYYPMGTQAWEKAREEHSARLGAINAVLADVERMAEYLASDPHQQLETRKEVLHD
tara:strand:- start:31 stop:324 length:294 start_codon:yes stop_codon:yes gene_type:complete